jgi:hypothetical protein
MATSIQSTEFTKSVLALMTEAFESVKGYFLDPKTTLFDTLAEINAAEASVPVGGRCATIAAQVTHVNFSLEVTERFLLTGQNEQYDWGEIWRTVREVTPEEWTALQNRLRETYQRLRGLVETYEQWDADGRVTEAINVIVHVAYHLGEIRQAMCIVKE